MLGQFISGLLARLGIGGATPVPSVPAAVPIAVAKPPVTVKIHDPNRALDIAATLITEPSEGTFLKPYQDPVGIWTYGTGATRDLNGNPVTKDTPPLTPAQDKQLLMRDMRSALGAVQADAKVPLTDDEEAALVDFVFNDGAGAFAKSSVLRDLNAGNYAKAADDLLLWDHAGGRVLAGLVKRCAQRRTVFLTPDDKLSTTTQELT